MALGEQGYEGIVVELDEFLAPEDQRGEGAGEHEIDGAEKAFGPSVYGAERSGDPGMQVDPLSHLALAAYQARRVGFSYVRTGHFAGL